MAYLYALCDAAGFARYVGSSSNPWARYTNHVSRFAALAVREWVAELRAAGKEPMICILGEVADAQRFEAEANLIRCLSQNLKLLNNGGAQRLRREQKRSGASPASTQLAAEIAKRGLSQRDVARLVGTNAAVVSRIVRGHRRPGRVLALAFERVFGVDPALWDVAPESEKGAA